MDKYKRLVSNTMLFAISTFSSKLLSFVMAPLFSYWFETQEMNGIKELLNQCASLLIPLVSLGIANAVIRFGLEKGIRKSAIYMNGLVSIGMGFVLLLLLYPLLSRIALFRDYIALLYVYLLVSCLRTLNCQFCRARQLNRLYAIDGILCTITTCGFYVLFLRVLNMGPTGYLLAIICADGLSALFLFAVTKTWRFLDFKRFDTKLLKKMLRYACRWCLRPSSGGSPTPATSFSWPPCWRTALPGRRCWGPVISCPPSCPSFPLFLPKRGRSLRSQTERIHSANSFFPACSAPTRA